MSYNDFRTQVTYMVTVIENDLEKLKSLAEDANGKISTMSSTTTNETTKAPGDWVGQSQESRTLINVSRCTIPIAMVCFSVIDMMGQWMKVKHDDDFGSSAHTFFAELAGRNELSNEDRKQKIKEYFRHGVMHSFFMRERCSVAYPPYDTNTLFVDFEINKCTMDVRFLLQVVQTGMKNMLTYLEDETNPKAQQAFNGHQIWEQAH
ncbi:hypothetical protein F0L74_23160 [Chitinophaga agrisoli]|uniref:Uncharacterized protein n=1 Tax=Chitinophaga agrisoli TaxID=2607653 RepID=A0A5B2VHQ4_9BACT|nr:hypothetical protein [Chitinophaga agrisoli]KAA2239113.1 hypothetical protein F0L74_23160 [Chitinophaga agrisoli]